MKETEIARENLKIVGASPSVVWIKSKIRSQVHKQTCQRWLEFLERDKKIYHRLWGHGITGNAEEKITDLKQAIKLYEDAGI